jgi:hypothetical protein
MDMQQMSFKSGRKSNAAFKTPKKPLQPWEEEALERACKTERLRALRLEKEEAERVQAQLKAASTPGQ